MREGSTRTGSDDRLWIVGLSLLAVGILVHAVRAPIDGWIPSGDDGFWSIMARSVFSSHPPLLGSSSSGGVAVGTGFHHLGPLGFYLLAPFVAVFGSVGVAVGSGVVNAAAAVVAVAAVRAGLGGRSGWVALLGSAALAVTMGSELLIDPWNPHLATMPLWCALACALAVLAGRTWWAAPGMAAASLALQTHLSFAPLAALAGAALVGGALYWGTRSVDGRTVLTAPDERRPGLRPLLAALGVTLVVNLPVLIQQFFGAGPGNLTQALSGGRDQDLPIGRVAGLRVVSQAFVPSNWLPGSWSPQVVRVAHLATPWLTVAAMLVVVVLVVLAVRAGRLRVAVRSGFVLAALALGAWVAGGLGLRMFGAPLTLARWAWPLALCWAVVVFDGASRLWATRDRVVAVVEQDEDEDEDRGRSPEEVRVVRASTRSRRPDVFAASCLVLMAVLVVVNLPARDEGSGAKPFFREPIGRMLDEVGPEVAELGRPYLAGTSQTLAAEATVALMDWLDERGVPFTLDDPVALRQAGEQHREDGAATATVRLRGGVEALGPVPDGFRTIYAEEPVTDNELEWYLRTATGAEERLVALLDRMTTDEELRRRVDPAPGSPLDVARYGWSPSLCGVNRELPLRNPVVQRDVIDDAERERLCALDERIFDGALAVDVGPPPVG